MPCRLTLFRIMILSGEIRNFRLFAAWPPVQAASFIAGKAKFKEQAAVAAVPGGFVLRTPLWRMDMPGQESKTASRNLPGLAVSAAINKVAHGKHRAAMKRPPRG
jgi:hypothetical protein